MFKRLAKQLIQELDSERRLIPVTSLAHTDSFRPLSLVTKEQSRLPWHTRKYSPSPFKLADVLVEGATMEIELKHSAPLLFSANTCHKSGARLNLMIQSAEVDVGGLSLTCLSASPVSVRKSYVDIRDLWRTGMSISILQQLYPKLHFYVVTEAFEIMEPLLIEETAQAGGKGEVNAAEILKIKGLNTRAKKKSMLIPRGTVLAYAVEKLQTYEEELVVFSQQLPATLVSSLTYDAFQDELGSSLAGISQDTERTENQDLWGPVNNICSSVQDLDYLLETTLEKKKMAQQLEMMDGVLEWILFVDEGSNFTDCSLTNEEDDLTNEMLQICRLGLETEKDSITCLWNSEAHLELAALYSSLYALQILTR
ncbi:LOW QUALITY PROTEIN: gasdermin-D-like [Rhineura floridana]|uniref:LOW QUALITY PROTEIN: gasdermin-D-like n=1 Tax=Rhineura floridana TaxID=261503 RepID=UPI002AC83DA2|nr:LOW QUALITY PROTEIN: gasdermin-D-like [Rhineura floridana]